jgi:ribosomal protein S18 acetylase RimI-like enzyme
MTSTNIIKATLEDLEKLEKIGKQTFVETFSAVNTAENMVKYLEENLSLEQLLSELNDSNAAFYFALNNNDVVGYLKLNTGVAQTELKDNQSLEIERIYVLKAFHGKNIGQLLFEKAIQEAKKIHVTYVWLGVWEQNQRAINFYKKNGFVEFDKHIFILGNDEQTDIMMKLEMVKQ